MPARSLGKQENSLREARAARSVLVTTLVDRVTAWHLDEDPDAGRRTLRGATLEGGGTVAVDGREMGWPVDVGLEARRIAGCESSAILVETAPDQWKPVPMTCGSRLCPVDHRVRAGRASAGWRAVLEAAAADGALLIHMTLTQPLHALAGSAVLPHERGRWEGVTPTADATEWLPAVAGESMLASYGRWRDHWRRSRNQGSRRDRWKASLGGYIYGIEWTLRSGRRGAPDRQEPRWHCHGHVLCTIPRGPAQDEWRRSLDGHGSARRGYEPRLVEDWCAASYRHAASSPRAQDWREVDPAKVHEVLKYPVKLGEMTVAAIVEVYGALRGLRAHHIGGPWHSASQSRWAEPWATWLSHRPDVRARVLEIWRREGIEAGWHLYTGQPEQGPARLSIRTGVDADGTPRRDVWDEPDMRRWSSILRGAVVLDAEPHVEELFDLRPDLMVSQG